MSFKLENCKQILIVGAGHGIGLAFVQEIKRSNPNIKIFATFRNKSLAGELLAMENITCFQTNPCNEEEVQMFSEKIEGEIDLVINCVGVLHGDGLSPEKSLRNINEKDFSEVMKVNAFVTPLLAKYLDPKISKETISCFVTISAKVGSIEDNHLGGWYSYRASKAALNMLLKCISIEWERKRKNCAVLAIHPGTTDTDLSRPFSKNVKYTIYSPAETARNILNTLEGKESKDTGSFLSYDNKKIPW